MSSANTPTKQESGIARKDNPFAKQTDRNHVNAGTVEIEASRAIAEAQGKLVIAKNFPRNPERSYANMIESCQRQSFAEQAMYSFPRGGQTVSGPSIRMAEELARCWGNIEFGIRELSRREGESEMEAYAWDLEANVYRTIKFTVKHLRDKRGGPEQLKDERDIYEVTANMGGRRMRACLLTILPADYVDDAVLECEKTLKKENGEPLVNRVRKALVAFKKLGISGDMIEGRLGKKVSEMFPDDLAGLITIYNSINEGQSSAADWFEGEGKEKKPTLNSLKKPDEKKEEKKEETPPAQPAAETTKAEVEKETPPTTNEQPEPPATNDNEEIL